MSKLAPVSLPRFGRGEGPSDVPVDVYPRRMKAARAAVETAGLDVLVVYADREHFANMTWLCGFDPRFEEAVLLLAGDGRTRLLVGNECVGYLPDEALGIPVEMFQELSLMGQSRDNSRPLRDVFDDFGIGAGCRVGCAGWKYFDSSLLGDGAIEIPAYMVDCLRDLTGGARYVSNAGHLFMHPDSGLRIINEVDQVAAWEYAATRTSESVLSLLGHIRRGVRERQLEHHLAADGLPLSCHRMIGFGDKARRGLASPSDNAARLGDPFTVAFGVRGSLTCRAGCVARGPEDLPAGDRDFYEAMARNYFDVVADWYAHVRVGAIAGDVFAAVEDRRDGGLYDFAVNPGHYLHLDEWVHSPFVPGGRIELRSGMALQMDIIPVSRGPFYYINAEDGIILADAELRAQIAERYAPCWQRICRRRDFMQEALGLTLDESVLPLSNIPAWLCPYILSPQDALTL